MLTTSAMCWARRSSSASPLKRRPEAKPPSAMTRSRETMLVGCSSGKAVGFSANSALTSSGHAIGATSGSSQNTRISCVPMSSAPVRSPASSSRSRRSAADQSSASWKR
jgi:hypothetical protein